MSSTPAQKLERLLRETRPAPLTLDLRSGLPGLDALLDDTGLPIGQLTEWLGAPSSGKTGLLRTLVRAVRHRGIPVAWIDARSELLAGDWADASAPAPLWVLRPPSPVDAHFCAEVVLRTRSFGLVVIDGGPPLSDASGVRLQRMARKAAAALIRVRTPNEPSSRLVRHRLTFNANSPSISTYLSKRAPLSWPVHAQRMRGGPQHSQPLYLVEPTPQRLTAQPISPAGRTRAGARYGR
jgi:hypothetical protein